MRLTRLLAASLVLVLSLLVLDEGVANSDKKPPARDRSKAWELATHVVAGKVASLEQLDAEGKSDSSGAHFTLTLTVSQILKGSGPRKGDKMKLDGLRSGAKRQKLVPKVNDVVEAYLRKREDKYVLLVPNGFTRRAAGATNEEKK
jgi:hypothetical protein